MNLLDGNLILHNEQNNPTREEGGKTNDLNHFENTAWVCKVPAAHVPVWAPGAGGQAAEEPAKKLSAGVEIPTQRGWGVQISGSAKKVFYE